LKEQEISRREIRRFIFKAIDPTRCLKAWGWIFIKTACGGQWSKTFNLSSPLLAVWFGQVYLRQEVIISLVFFEYNIDLWIGLYPESGTSYHVYSYYFINALKSKWKIPLILQKFATELPKIIASVKTAPFYDEAKQKQIEVILVSELKAKTAQFFGKAHKTVDL